MKEEMVKFLRKIKTIIENTNELSADKVDWDQALKNDEALTSILGFIDDKLKELT